MVTLMTTEQFKEFTEEVIPQQLFHVLPTDIDERTGAKLEEQILVVLIAANPECLKHKPLRWFINTYLTKPNPDEIEMQSDEMSPEDYAELHSTPITEEELFREIQENERNPENL
jgi:hypothetical protein